MKMPIGATMRGLLRRMRDILRVGRDLALVAFDAPVLLILRAGRRERTQVRARVAIFNMHGGGDLLLSLPCLKRLREEFPAERYVLTLFCGPMAMELAALYAPVDDLVAVDRYRLVRSVRYRISVLTMIVRGNFTVALQPTFNRMLAVEDALIHATGAERIFGSAGSPMFTGRMARWLADRWYSRLVQPSPGTMHELDRYAEFLLGLGWRPPEGRIAALMPPPGPAPTDLADFVLIIPDASSPLKSWSIGNFEQLAHELAERTKIPIVFAGASGAKRPKDEFVRWRDGDFIDLTGRTGVADFLRLIGAARLIVTNDSGGLHLGVALGRPVVAVAGGGLPQRYHPYPAGAGATQLRIVENRLPCYGCNWRCIYSVAAGSAARCIESVTVQQVLDAVQDLERGTPGSRQSPPKLAERA
jgi:ADP-heptose:LPS heptosyltransferase